MDSNRHLNATGKLTYDQLTFNKSLCETKIYINYSLSTVKLKHVCIYIYIVYEFIVVVTYQRTPWTSTSIYTKPNTINPGYFISLFLKAM